MPGNYPKHTSVRARRNKASTASELSEPEGEVVIPPLPKRFKRDSEGCVKEVEWNPMTLEWWADLWPSPMAEEYLDSDIHGLYRLALLIDNFWENPDSKTHAEVRLAQQAYGLTPLDRRRLEWSVENTKKAQREGQRGSQPPQSMPESERQTGDPRLHLVG